MGHRVLRSRGPGGMKFSKGWEFTFWLCHLLGKFINLPGSQQLPLQDEEIKKSCTVHAISMVALLLLEKAMQFP